MFIQDRIIGEDRKDATEDKGQYTRVAFDEYQAPPNISRSDPEAKPSLIGRCLKMLLFLTCLGAAGFVGYYFLIRSDSDYAIHMGGNGNDTGESPISPESGQGSLTVSTPTIPPFNVEPEPTIDNVVPADMQAPHFSPVADPTEPMPTLMPIGPNVSPSSSNLPGGAGGPGSSGSGYDGMGGVGEAGSSGPGYSGTGGAGGPVSSGPGTGSISTSSSGASSIKSIIQQKSPSSDLESPASAANKALQWMMTSDQFPTGDADQTIQRFVLATLYFSLNGPDWNSGTSSQGKWNLASDDYTRHHVCSWELVTCYGSDAITAKVSEITLDRVFEDDSSHRISKIPRELGLLSTLTKLQITRNNIVGGIPPELGAVSQLTKLDLSNNGLAGPIPDISSLSNLSSLKLFNNQLTGDTRNLRPMSNLREIMLFGNSGLGHQEAASRCDVREGTPPSVLVDCVAGSGSLCPCCQGVTPTSGTTCVDPESCEKHSCSR